MSRFYITTPIYYINAEPHLGHAYTSMVADAVARAHRLSGDEVFFLTGTDEHGQKVERAAKKSGLPVKAFADQTAQRFRDILPVLGISHDDFIRTSEPRHYAAAQALWRAVKERGFIYKSKYEGWYCTVDEVFVPETQLVDGRCPTCGSAVEKIEEESYFFKLSAFQQPLIEHYRQHPEFLVPAMRRNEMLSFLEAGLDDLSISRTSLKWGIPVPDDPAHVMYVWFDALTNYMTAVGYGDPTPSGEARFKKFWPVDVHLIGKEIVRQHAIYWPAFLMAADLPLPRQVVSHGWWLMDGAKMSKSKGNVARPQEYVERFGLDALRYFVYREMILGQDANFGDEAILTRYNADLANDFGNLVSRATTMIHRYCEGRVPAPDPALLGQEAEQALARTAADTITAARSATLAFDLSGALRAIWELVGATNRYIVTREPWKLAKSGPPQALATTLYAAADTVRIIADLLRPFMPGTAVKTLSMLGVAADPHAWTRLGPGALTAGSHLGETTPLFPRIEQSVEELRAMSTGESPESQVAGRKSQVGSEPAVAGAGSAAASPAPTAATSPPSPQPPAPSPEGVISIDDFMKVELRVARVLAAERVPKSKKLLKLSVDTGSDQRTIVAGIAEAYEPEALVDRTIAIVFNLKPATLMGIQSNGMVLAATNAEGKPQLVSFDAPPPAPGSRVR